MGGEHKPDALFDQAYDELRRLARRFFRDQPTPHTLQATALVHEVYIKLAASSSEIRDEQHMARLCAQAMRCVLIDSARSRTSRKRREQVNAKTQEADAAWAAELFELDLLVQRYEELDPRRSKLVKLHVFGGFSITECADLLSISRRTATEDWRIARAWLASRLSRGDGASRRVTDSGSNVENEDL